MACARVMRGIASIAKLVTPASASAFEVSPAVSGARCPISTCPLRNLPISSPVGGATFTTTSAPNAASAPPTVAFASVYCSSGWPEPSPAPDSTMTSLCSARAPATSGISATLRSPAAVSFGTPIFIRTIQPQMRELRGLGAAI